MSVTHKLESMPNNPESNWNFLIQYPDLILTMN